MVFEAGGLEEITSGMATGRKEKALQDDWAGPAPAEGGYSLRVRIALPLGQNGPIPRAQPSVTQSAQHKGIVWFLLWTNGYS